MIKYIAIAFLLISDQLHSQTKPEKQYNIAVVFEKECFRKMKIIGCNMYKVIPELSDTHEFIKDKISVNYNGEFTIPITKDTMIITVQHVNQEVFQFHKGDPTGRIRKYRKVIEKP